MSRPREFRTVNLEVCYVRPELDSRGRIVLLGPCRDDGGPRLQITLNCNDWALRVLHRRVMDRAEVLREQARTHAAGVEAALKDIPLLEVKR